MGIISYGFFLLMCIVTFAYVESLTCGQTVCKENENCCEKRKECCCSDGPTGGSYHCESGTTVGLHWYEVVIIVVFVVGLCAGVAVCFVLYRRRRRNM